MKIQAFEINEEGFIIDVHVVDENEETEFIKIQPPNGLYRAKWAEVEWIEDMTQEEIDAVNNQPKKPTTDDYLVDLDFRLSMLELGL